MNKKAILLVSFGTSHLDTKAATIDQITQLVSYTYPDSLVYTAFTSGMIRRILAQRAHHILSVEQALEQAVADGVTHLTVQPTHLLLGDEFDKLKSALTGFVGRFTQVSIGLPLLHSPADLSKVVDLFISEFPQKPHTAVVLMGHGTTHHYNPIYQSLQRVFEQKNASFFVGTVEAQPDLAAVITQLKAAGITNVTLTPLMLVAGDHAKNDMASDHPTSWKTQLLQAGFQVEISLKGMGEYPEIQQIYLDHLAEATPFIPHN